MLFENCNTTSLLIQKHQQLNEYAVLMLYWVQTGFENRNKNTSKANVTSIRNNSPVLSSITELTNHLTRITFDLDLIALRAHVHLNSFTSRFTRLKKLLTAGARIREFFKLTKQLSKEKTLEAVRDFIIMPSLRRRKNPGWSSSVPKPMIGLEILNKGKTVIAHSLAYPYLFRKLSQLKWTVEAFGISLKLEFQADEEKQDVTDFRKIHLPKVTKPQIEYGQSYWAFILFL